MLRSRIENVNHKSKEANSQSPLQPTDTEDPAMVRMANAYGRALVRELRHSHEQRTGATAEPRALGAPRLPTNVRGNETVSTVTTSPGQALALLSEGDLGSARSLGVQDSDT